MPRKISRSSKRKGGSAAYTASVYGGPGQQQAMEGRGNEIAYNQAAISGGAVASLMPAQYPGGGILTDVAVPVALVAANHFYKPRAQSSKKKYGRKFRRGGAGAADLPRLEAQLLDVQTNGINSDIVKAFAANETNNAPAGIVNVEQLNTKGGKGCAIMMPVFLKSLSRKFYKKSKGKRRSSRKSRGKRYRK